MNNLDYSKHRLNDFSELMEYRQNLGRDVFYSFVNTAYSWLMKMEIGDQMDISKKPEVTNRNRDLFIKVACMFISEGNDSYMFSNDYTIICRYDREKEKKEIADLYLKLEQKRQKPATARTSYFQNHHPKSRSSVGVPTMKIFFLRIGTFCQCPIYAITLDGTKEL